MAARKPRATQRREPEPPAAPPEVDPNMTLDPHGFITWKIGEQTFHLRPLKALEFMELDWLRTNGAEEVMEQLTAAVLLPKSTEEERGARQEAMEKANTANNEWVLGWWEMLFTHGEMNGAPFPRSDVPATIFQKGSMGKVLAHLQGPPLPGAR